MSKASKIVDALKKDKVETWLLSDDDSPCTVDEWVPTGCAALDAVLGGGLPLGRITEMSGDPSSGKSLIGAQIIAVAQELGMIGVYEDTETAVSKEMMEMLGVNINELIYASHDTIEEVFNFFMATIEKVEKIAPDTTIVIVWDSVAATSSKAEMSKDFGQTGYLDHARIISQSLRKMTRVISKKRVAVLFLNQTRTKIGVVFGDSTATFGGKAISFHASVRLALTLSTKIKVKTKGKRPKIIGMNTRAVCTKNKVAMPFKEALLPIYFGNGIDEAGSAYYWLIEEGYITGGSWKIIELGGKEHKFQKSGWDKLYEKYANEIDELIYSSIDEDIVGEEIEDDDTDN